MKVTVLRAGPLTTIQDKGRFGYMGSGIGQSGVMDSESYYKANRLVGNKDDEAVLETTIIGPDLYFDDNAIIAFMGADMDVELEGKKLLRGMPHFIHKNSTLKCGMARNGARTYFAINGGFDTPIVMGSRSTNLKCQIGGIDGRKLIDGDEISFTSTCIKESEIRKILKNREKVNLYKKEVEIRVIEGPQADCFTDEGKKTFLSAEFTVSNDSDRMGIRLDGESIESKNGSDIVSDGIAFGSIQITSSGQPIILMADHQTTGGYAKIATVITEDLSTLAQVMPGDKITFKKVNIDQVQKRSVFEKFFG